MSCYLLSITGTLNPILTELEIDYRIRDRKISGIRSLSAIDKAISCDPTSCSLSDSMGVSMISKSNAGIIPCER